MSRFRPQKFKAVHSVEPGVVMDDDDLDDDGNGEGAVHMVHALQPGGHSRKRVPRCSVLLSGYKVDALIDTGASINVIATPVRDTIPTIMEHNELQQQVGKALSRRKDSNDKMSRKRGAKERDICVGDMVLVKCRRGGMPIDVSSGDQDYDDAMLQSSGFGSNGAFIAGDVQSPGGSMGLDHGSGDQLVEESIVSGSGQVGPITSTRGDGPYNLRPRPRCSTRFRDFVVN
ncbi:hypothetical protein NDU88_004866 [Pleurodeles waltl]|uniref:Peptidase A2 domain-containing protein n=1 Tax=Pleurodeles waltl TaxID=8319 RepID=A0AAV7WWP9_PLEWA|nr:hypothetical protein NDU88_004866 [Pleurodeles waltl]